MLYPAQCCLCAEMTADDGQLCADCWRETPFLRGLCCDLCGARQLDAGQDETVVCDDCTALARPWRKGRAAISYDGAGRRLVLSLKHSDRLDLVAPAADWMVRAGQDVLRGGACLVPIPVSRRRLLRRKYNQAAELARRIADRARLQVVPDGLVRTVATKVQDGLTVAERFANVENVIHCNPARADRLNGKDVTIIDDVMTSGATLSAAARALKAAGAARVDVLVLARVEKTP